MQATWKTHRLQAKMEGKQQEAFLILKEDLSAHVFSDIFHKDFQARHMADRAQGKSDRDSRAVKSDPPPRNHISKTGKGTGGALSSKIMKINFKNWQQL